MAFHGRLGGRASEDAGTQVGGVSRFKGPPCPGAAAQACYGVAFYLGGNDAIAGRDIRIYPIHDRMGLGPSPANSVEGLLAGRGFSGRPRSRCGWAVAGDAAVVGSDTWRSGAPNRDWRRSGDAGRGWYRYRLHRFDRGVVLLRHYGWFELPGGRGPRAGRRWFGGLVGAVSGSWYWMALRLGGTCGVLESGRRHSWEATRWRHGARPQRRGAPTSLGLATVPRGGLTRKRSRTEGCRRPAPSRISTDAPEYSTSGPLLMQAGGESSYRGAEASLSRCLTAQSPTLSRGARTIPWAWFWRVRIRPGGGAIAEFRVRRSWLRNPDFDLARRGAGDHALDSRGRARQGSLDSFSSSHLMRNRPTSSGLDCVEPRRKSENRPSRPARGNT